MSRAGLTDSVQAKVDALIIAELMNDLLQYQKRNHRYVLLLKICLDKSKANG